MKAVKKNNWAICLILMIIILAQVLYMTHVFANGRNSIHSDEPWSFGLANSTDGPYIYMTDDQQNMKNMFYWEDGKVLRDYVSVQKDERFDYSNVIYNVGRDMHPPLYFLVLHTVCSLFPDSYSMWYGFAINIIAFIIGQFFMYKTVKMLTDSEYISIAGVILWGFCVGALSVTIFIRLYGMSTMFIIALTYFYAKMMKGKEFRFRNDILPIGIITFLGSLTNNYFIVVAFVFAACFCMYFLCTKRYKTLCVFAVTLLLAELAVLCLVPNMLSRATSRVESSSSTGSARRANYDYQLRWCVYYVSTELFGIIIRPYATMTLAYIEYFIAGVLLLLIPIGFIVRKEKWFGNFMKKSICFFKKVILVVYYKIRFLPICLFTMFLASVSVILFTAYLISIPHMQAHTDRYLSAAFPLVTIFALVTVYKLIILCVGEKKQRQIGMVLLFCAVITVLWNQAVFDSPYQFSDLAIDEDYMTNEEVRQLTREKNCILGMTQGWHLEMAPNYMLDADNFFAFYAKEYEQIGEELEKIPEEEKEVYFIFNGDGIAPISNYAGLNIEYEEEAKKTYGREDVENVIKGMHFCECYEYIGYTYSFSDKYEIYQIR